MYFRKRIGEDGEELACRYLKQNNYIIKDRNFRTRQGEIDIIAYDKIQKELVFVEVKARTNTKYIKPIEAVNMEKQKHIMKVAKYYLYKNKLENMAIRVDAIEIYFEKKSPQIHHIKQIVW